MTMHKRYVIADEFADLVGVSAAAISVAIKKGIIDTININDRRFIDLSTQLHHYLSVTKKQISPERRKKLESIIRSLPAPPPPTDEIHDGMTMAQAREKQEIYKARKAKIDYELSIGQLVRVSTVRTEWLRIAALIRKSILNIPDRIAPLVAAEREQAQCWDILDRECRMVLEELSDKLSFEDANGAVPDGYSASRAVDDK